MEPSSHHNSLVACCFCVVVAWEPARSGFKTAAKHLLKGELGWMEMSALFYWIRQSTEVDNNGAGFVLVGTALGSLVIF